MATSISITPFEDRLHRDAVIELWTSVFGYDSPRNEPSLVIDKKLAVADELFFVATKDDLIGTVMAGYDGHRGWIYSLAVSPDYQRQGIGTALMQHAERALSELGCVKINLQILESNEQVEQFYAALGYATEARINMGKCLIETIDQGHE